MTESTRSEARVNTVLGPVPATDLGIVAVHEALLSVVPGTQFAPDITIDRAEIFDTLVGKLRAFRECGGGTLVDSTGMFHGRDLSLYEALSRSTGVHIVASTGLGPEEMLGGYFLTPQTNPPTPWPAERFADLFTSEITEGMVVPRLERRAAAGMVATEADRAGMTAVEESLYRGAARTALATGVPVSLRFGVDPLGELDIVLEEGLPADRVVVGGLDRRDPTIAAAALEVARRGAYVAFDHVGWPADDHLGDEERAERIAELDGAGLGHRVLLSCSAIGVAKGLPPRDIPLSTVIDVARSLESRGVGEAVRRFLQDNPRELLSVSPAQSA